MTRIVACVILYVHACKKGSARRNGAGVKIIETMKHNQLIRSIKLRINKQRRDNDGYFGSEKPETEYRALTQESAYRGWHEYLDGVCEKEVRSNDWIDDMGKYDDRKPTGWNMYYIGVFDSNNKPYLEARLRRRHNRQDIDRHTYIDIDVSKLKALQGRHRTLLGLKDHE